MTTAISLMQVDLTGCRIIGAITEVFGHLGPKHHGVILGQNPIDQQVYIAENNHDGYQICTYADFERRYSGNGEIIIEPNDGPIENLAVANRAIEEINRGGMGLYHLIVNNCECFVNRAMHGKSTSQQVINTVLGTLAVMGVVYVLSKTIRQAR